MRLPAAPGFAAEGLRTVAFRSPQWPVAAPVSTPPGLGSSDPVVGWAANSPAPGSAA